MMVEKTRAEAIIGFAVKAGRIVCGADNIEKNRRIRLVICDIDLSENTLKKMITVARNANIRLLIAQNPIEDIVHRKNVKVIGITDLQMSEAILKDLAGFEEKSLDF